LDENVGSILKRFSEGGPRFAFTHAYPYVKTREGDTLLLVPRPPFRIPPEAIKTAPQGSIVEHVDLAKELQKAVFLSPGVADAMRDGRWDAAALYRQATREKVKVFNNTLWLESEIKQIWESEPRALWKTAVIQRNSVDRVAGATVEGLLFQQTETFYDRPRAGLWFGVWADDALWKAVKGAFPLMSDTGLGGSRSVGKGHFAFSQPMDWRQWFHQPEAQQRFLNLSHYIPTSARKAEPVVYDLDVIRQKAENRYPQGVQRVYVAALRAFKPGGLFAADPGTDRFYGRLLPLGAVDDRTIYFNGITVPLWGAWEV